MSDKTLGDGTGCIITLQELQDKLLQISHQDHRWTAVPEYSRGTKRGRQVRAVRIWYTNPELREMPNMICFELPAFPDEIWGDPEGALICLHPSLITPVMEGLYWEGDELKRDSLKDFGRFWEPLRDVLWRPDV